jgi:transglutaminase-like putative cysteine protease
VQRYLDADAGSRVPGRAEDLNAILDDPSYALSVYRPVYATARRVVGGARSPYEAVLALESWFRLRGGFVYDERPPPSDSRAPLLDFVTRTKAGYCQHFAGAMALMLHAGVWRVAVGF